MRIKLRFGKQIDHAEHAVHRRTDLVAHRRKEARLCNIGFFRRNFGAFGVGPQRLDVGEVEHGRENSLDRAVGAPVNPKILVQISNFAVGPTDAVEPPTGCFRAFQQIAANGAVVGMQGGEEILEDGFDVGCDAPDLARTRRPILFAAARIKIPPAHGCGLERHFQALAGFFELFEQTGLCDNGQA